MCLVLDLIFDWDVCSAVEALDLGFGLELFGLQDLLEAFRVEVDRALAVAHRGQIHDELAAYWALLRELVSSRKDVEYYEFLCFHFIYFI